MIIQVKTTEDGTTSKGDPYKRVKTSDGKTFSCFKENLLDLIKPGAWLDIEFTEEGKYKNITGLKIVEKPAEAEQYVNDEEARRSCIHAAARLAQAKAQVLTAVINNGLWPKDRQPPLPVINSSTLLHDAFMFLKAVKGEISIAGLDVMLGTEQQDAGEPSKVPPVIKLNKAAVQKVEDWLKEHGKTTDWAKGIVGSLAAYIAKGKTVDDLVRELEAEVAVPNEEEMPF